MRSRPPFLLPRDRADTAAHGVRRRSAGGVEARLEAEWPRGRVPRRGLPSPPDLVDGGGEERQFGGGELDGVGLAMVAAAQPNPPG